MIIYPKATNAGRPITGRTFGETTQGARSLYNHMVTRSERSVNSLLVLHLCWWYNALDLIAGAGLAGASGIDIKEEGERTMRGTRWLVGLGLALLMLSLVACEGYSQTGVQSSSSSSTSGGKLTVRTKKANGSVVQDMETAAAGGWILDAEVTLTVGKGSYKIELLGEDEQVTLTLEAGAGETVSGQGWMVTDGFGEASYRVTADGAEEVEYTIDYTFR